jgi:hypothetical protein
LLIDVDPEIDKLVHSDGKYEMREENRGLSYADSRSFEILRIARSCRRDVMFGHRMTFADRTDRAGCDGLAIWAIWPRRRPIQIKTQDVSGSVVFFAALELNFFWAGGEHGG